MSPSSINSSAFSKLKDLATWLSETAKMEEEEKNTFRCVDNDRHAKVRPLLEELGYSKIKGHGYTMFRISGKAEIHTTPNYRSLFFPLSVGSGNDSIAPGELQVAGEALKPGTFIHFTSGLVLDAQLDCLIVLLPETR